jgi:hypothetical protein
MKPLTLLLALLATSSFAYQTEYEQRSQDYSPVRFGLEVGGLFTIPVLWPTDGTDSKLGLGLRLVPEVQYSLGDHFYLNGFAGYEFTTWGYRQANPSDGSTDDFSVKSNFLTMGLAGQYNFARRGSFASMGVSTDIPFHSDLTDNVNYGDGTGETLTGRFHDEQTSVFLDFGLGRQISPMVGIVVGYRLPLVPIYDVYNAYPSTIDLHQINVNLRFTLP